MCRDTDVIPFLLQAGWQRQLHDLPNHIFDASSPARRITASQRVTSLITKAAELGAVGVVAGTAMSGLAQVLVSALTSIILMYIFAMSVSLFRRC